MELESTPFPTLPVHSAAIASPAEAAQPATVPRPTAAEAVEPMVEDQTAVTDAVSKQAPTKELDTTTPTNPAPVPALNSASASLASTSSPSAPTLNSATPTPADPDPDPAPAPAPTPIVELLSISPTDPSRTRTFLAKYFLPVEHDAPLRAALDLPEAYFAPTASELQQAFAGQVRKREQLVDAPMLTQKLRDQEEAKKTKEKAGRWPQTRIRVRFADRSQLEGVFPSTDKMVAIYEFVRLAIADQHRDKPFVLYQTPPKREFKKGAPELKGKSLMDLQLTPSSVFYIKWEDEQLSSTTPPPLLPALLGAASELPIPPTFDPRKEQTPPEGAPKPKTQKLGFGGSSGKVTPSWLKLGKSGKK